MWKHVSEDFWAENRASKVDQVNDIVKGIIDQVKNDGDKALIELAEKFDKVKLKSVVVTRDEIEEAYDLRPPSGLGYRR